MNFQQALAMLAANGAVRRPGGEPIRIQRDAVPVYAGGDGCTLQGCNWLLCRFPMVQHPDTGRFSIPRSFTDEEMRADDWEVVEEVAI
ncbi:MAG: hypothetical protein GJU76_11830 [Gallionella sp.]|jgi:hypothetical protein|nr:hypothetical protein [Gallionella sp.]